MVPIIRIEANPLVLVRIYDALLNKKKINCKVILFASSQKKQYNEQDCIRLMRVPLALVLC